MVAILVELLRNKKADIKQASKKYRKKFIWREKEKFYHFEYFLFAFRMFFWWMISINETTEMYVCSNFEFRERPWIYSLQGIGRHTGRHRQAFEKNEKINISRFICKLKMLMVYGANISF